MFNECKNAQAQGNIGLGAAIAWFTKNRYQVSVPLTDTQFYDLVTEREGIFRSVQVKTVRTRSKAGTFKVELRGKHGTRVVKQFDASNVDLLFVLTGEGQQYLIPRSEIRTVRSVDVGGKKYAEWMVK